MRRARRLALEALEDRCTPAIMGIPWIDPQHLTLSFVPDGTTAGASGSTLQQALATEAPSGSGTLAILQAFQTWAVLGNVNIGLVGDGGQALGAIGAVQGDPRFGDIRFGGYAFLGDTTTLADTTYPPPNGQTAAGDVQINTAMDFNNGSAYDLFGTARVGLPTWWHDRIGMAAPPDAPAPIARHRTLVPLLAHALCR